MNEQLFSGQIVEMRNRLWRIDELDQHYVTALPLNGDACERKTFLRVAEQIKAAALEPLSPALTGNYGLQQLLLQAYRFSLVHGSAPFLSLQKSAATPYNYQLVPLTLALEKSTTRLLIADDVGLGKTIEAGLIMSELQQRGKIKKILILTPAALQEQWQESLQYFFHTESRIISSFTRKEYEKELPAGANPWQFFDVVTASIDYAKSADVKHLILEQKWDLLLVDEVHLCARPHHGQGASKQMKRFELIRDLGSRIPNVIFLTATPHNGYSDCFASLLEILNPEIVQYDGDEVRFNKKRARYNVVQRNRKKLEQWYAQQGKQSPFPSRNQQEQIVHPTDKLNDLLEEVEAYGDRLLARTRNSVRQHTLATWVALHLQKRIISSPYALVRSLENRLRVLTGSWTAAEEVETDAFGDYIQDSFTEQERLSDEQASMRIDGWMSGEEACEELNHLLKKAKAVTPADDAKLTVLRDGILPELLRNDNKVILFTKYKDTLSYLAEQLKGQPYACFILHGDWSLAKRQEVFGAFDRATRAVLIATDVISEGLNLQRLSSCVVHYELPWNPNRLEQRNGRVDRIGQQKPVVQIRTLVLDKSLDREILNLLLEKQERIQLDRDYSGAFFGDEAYLRELLEEAHTRNRKRSNRKKKSDPGQFNLFAATGYQETRKAVKRSFGSEAEERKRLEKIEKESFFGSLDIELPEIDQRIRETVAIVGSKRDVEQFVRAALAQFGSAVLDRGDGFLTLVLNDVRLELPRYGRRIEKVTFSAELGFTHPDAVVLEMGHPLVRRLIEVVKADFFTQGGYYGRTAYFFSDRVKSVSFLYHVLIRFTVGLKEKRVIEELLTIGFYGHPAREIPEAERSQLRAVKTTQAPGEDQVTEMVQMALGFAPYHATLPQKIEERRIRLIEERQALYKKIVRESAGTEQPVWLDDSIHVTLSGFDLLAVAIVFPL